MFKPNNLFKHHYPLFAVLLLISISKPVFSQTNSLHDSLYYQTFPNALTVRLYGVKDYTGFTLAAAGNQPNLKYRANNTFNTGAGITYKNVSANLSVGLNALNHGVHTKGDTRSLDLQFHFFPRKWASDLLYLHYKGFYATQQSYPTSLPDVYYYRPDIRLNLIGFNLYRVQNFKQFSYRTAFNQNEWIKKSSGSLLFGGGIYYEDINSADSSLIPKIISHNFTNNNINNLHVISVGPGFGYAQTFVWHQHFYVLGSAVVNGNINFSTDKGVLFNSHKTSFAPGFIFKTGIGYGGNEWNVSVNYAGNILLAKQANASYVNTFPASEIRLMVAKQIMLKKPIPFVSKVIDGIFGKDD